MSVQASTALKFLVACSECKRQYDAGGLKPGSKFHCSCGQTIEVPRPRAHDADVVRCSSCSAPRLKGATACGHCGSDYTLHERDLHTICPGCMTRISDRARFCHHCGTAIVPQGEAGRPTKTPCPATSTAANRVKVALESSERRSQSKLAATKLPTIHNTAAATTKGGRRPASFSTWGAVLCGSCITTSCQ